MPDRPVLLVVEPDPTDPLDRFEGWLTEAGLALTVVRPYAGDPVPVSLAATGDHGAAGLLVLGGTMDSWDDGGYPWLADVRALLRSAEAEGRPTLAICLGAQLLALAHGGGVARGEHGPEAGLVEVHRRTTGDDDAVAAALPDRFVAATMHDDAITALPASATSLGEGTPYPHQVFRVGTCSWGVQFHPEVSPEGYADWCAPDQQDLADAVAARDAEVAPVARALARRFAALVRA